jgi:DNA-binding response OmpR family regulator
MWVMFKEGIMAAEDKSQEFRPPTRFARLRKILIVDKDAYWGPSIRLALEESGYYLNLVAEPREGCRRVMERAYDLVILSASLGQGALRAILELLARRVTPPAVIVLAGADELTVQKDCPGVPVHSVLRRPCAVEDVVDAVRALVGAPWTDHRKGA